MISKSARGTAGLLGLILALAVFISNRAAAHEDDPPSRVARLAYSQGSISFQPAGTEDWVSAVVNRPMTTGDKIWADNGGRVEMQLDGSLLRISSNTGISFLNLSDSVTQIQLTAGTLLVRVRRLDENESYEIDTPNLAFSILQPGLYRLSVDESGQTTAIKVSAGEGEVTGGGTAYTVHANEYISFAGSDQLVVNGEQYQREEDQFGRWSASRDSRVERSISARYVSQDVVGYEDLDEHGTWRPTPEYGNVWFPQTSMPDWAPYHNGHWAYIEPWGYTWVDDEPWGFAPFHYGRWVSVRGSWGWVPAPPRTERTVYARPVYAPALVAWINEGNGGGVAWFPLGPREVYVPSYPVSRRYVDNVNVSNTAVNTTVVDNYYNTTVVNKNVTVTNVKYVNQTVPGAVVATTSQAFATAQPVTRNVVRVDQRKLASAPVRAVAPPVVPAKQAVLGTQQVAAPKPPAAVETRAVVAKVAPPPPPAAFEKRQQAIKSNGGQPLTVAQVRQIQPPPTQRAAPVKIAPPATKTVTVQAAQANRTTSNPVPANKPPEVQPGQPTKPGQPQPNKPAAPPTVTPNKPENDPAATNKPAELRPQPNKPVQPEANKPVVPSSRPENRPADRPPNNPEPTPSKPATPNHAAPSPRKRPADRPSTPNEAAPRGEPNKPTPPPAHPNGLPLAEKQQEQEQLRAKQQRERQKVQQQQEMEYQQQAQEKADQARRQQLEQQHQQQTQQLQQQHAQEQQRIQEKQQQKQQAQPQKHEQKPPKQQQNPPDPPKEDRPPQPNSQLLM